MMLLFEFNGMWLCVDLFVYFDLSVVVIGDVMIGVCCYIGLYVSLCGDFGVIVVEDGSNV